MGQAKYLIDTNAVIDYLGHKLPLSGIEFLNEIIDLTPNLSIISKIEVLGFNTSKEHYSLLLSFMNDAFIFNLDADIVDKTIHIRQKNRIKLPDAIVAATALVNNLELITRNTSDFENISGLKVIDPHLL